jgi:hypothetical protein
VAVPIVLAMAGFGLLFGRTDVSAPLTLGPLTLGAPVETAIGLGSLGSAVLWLSWRTREARVVALRRAAASSGVRLRRARDRGRGASLSARHGGRRCRGLLAIPMAAVPAERTVLREATGPRIEISRAVSPLASYRSMFRDDLHDEVLFSATGAQLPARIRLAVLDDYDGAVFRTGGGSISCAGRRSAPPSRVRRWTRTSSSARWTGSGCRRPVSWHPSPSPGRGPRRSPTDSTSMTLAAAVQTAGWRQGDGYRLRASEPATSALAAASSPGDAGDGPEAPQACARGCRHVSGSGGAALEGLVALLRERGYLSHALTDAQAQWMADAGVDTFVPSAAGRSLARIDQLFTALLDREQDPRAEASGNYVAAIGDDEQFSVAVALLARELGFPRGSSWAPGWSPPIPTSRSAVTVRVVPTTWPRGSRCAVPQGSGSRWTRRPSTGRRRAAK